MKLLLVLIFLGLIGLSACQKLKRIEDKLALIKARQDLESLTRRDEFASILGILDGIELLLNQSDERRHVFDMDGNIMTQSVKSVEAMATQINRKFDVLMKAFGDEKRINSRYKGHVSLLERSFEEIRETLKNTTSIIAIVLENMPTVENLEQISTDLYAQMFDMCSNVLESNSSTNVIADAISRAESMQKQFAEQIETAMDKKMNKVIQSLNTDLSQKINTIVEAVRETGRSRRFISCLDLLSYGETKSGVYTIYPQQWYSPERVYCDMTTEGGGWTVFQRRQDGSQEFYQDWETYKEGFGDLDGEFWLGNELLSILTKDCCHELRIELADFEGNAGCVTYGNFKVYPEDKQYMLFVDGYMQKRSNVSFGDSFSYHSNKSFSTWDEDWDKVEKNNCAEYFQSGWWFGTCHKTDLNGKYLKGNLQMKNSGKGVTWNDWKGPQYSLKMSEMKFRKT